MIKDEESPLINDIISPDTYKYIKETIMMNTPPEPPILRIKRCIINDRDIKLDISHNVLSTKNVKERIKLIKVNESNMVVMPKDCSFHVELNYTKHCTNDLYVRIFPCTTDNEFKLRPIVSCPRHGKKVITTVNPEMLERATKSIVELYDTDARYETFELHRDVQISIIVKFWGPKMALDLVMKCYNTCHEAFKKEFPKLIFSLEQCVEPNKKYLVLSENSILFKVCASPARDCKSLTLVKKPVEYEEKNTEINKIETEMLSDQGYFVELEGVQYYPKMVSKEIIEFIDHLERYSNKTSSLVKLELEIIEKRIEETMKRNSNLSYEEEDVENRCFKMARRN